MNLNGNVNLSNDGTSRVLIINNNTFNHLATLNGFIRNGSGANHTFQKAGVGTLVLTSTTSPRRTTTSSAPPRSTAASCASRTTTPSAAPSPNSRRSASPRPAAARSRSPTTGRPPAALAYVGTTPPTAADVANALNLLPSILRTGGVVCVTSSNPAGPAHHLHRHLRRLLSRASTSRKSPASTSPPR